MNQGESRSPLPRRPGLAIAAALLAVASTGQLASAAESGRGGMPAPAAQGASTAELRVATIGYRLVRAGAARCSRHAVATGLLLHDIASHAPAERAALRRPDALGTGFGVRAVVPGSAAARAGVVPGDVLIAADGTDLEGFALHSIGKAATFDRIAALLDRIDAAGGQPGGLRLRLRGRSGERTMVLADEPACAGRFTLLPGRQPDAWSDGRYVAVTQAAADFASDDELAFLLGHELAHVALGHADTPRGALTALGIGAGRIRQQERDADRLGLQLAFAAGYDPRAALRLLDKLANARDIDHSATHPARAERLRLLEAEIAALLRDR